MASPAAVASSSAFSPDGLLNTFDYERAAEEALNPIRFANVVGGACDEVTVRENRRAYDRWHLVPRVMVDIDAAATNATVLGIPVSMPILLAPSATHRLYHPDGEQATARGAAAAGTICCISGVASCTAGEINDAAPGAPRFFMFGATRDRGMQRVYADVAQELGASALVLTVDAQIVGKRERARRAGHETGELGLLNAALGRKVDILKVDMRLTWDGLQQVVDESPLPIILKGVLSPADARRACDYGVAAVIVSNHGGRQLDSVIPTLDALPGVVEAVDGRAEVLVDGGVRRGTDVIKALALGARAVLIGRPAVYGLAVGGAAGVEHVLELLREELLSGLMLLGCPSLDQLTPEYLVEARERA